MPNFWPVIVLKGCQSSFGLAMQSKRYHRQCHRHDRRVGRMGHCEQVAEPHRGHRHGHVGSKFIGLVAVICTSTLVVSFAILAAFAADHPEPHDGPLPLPANYGNVGGCLVLHGDQAEPSATWLTPTDIGGTDFNCKISTWSHEPHGAIGFNCDGRKFLILPQDSAEQMLMVIQLTGQQSFSTYQLGRCAPE
jgi:hypothetical protein